MWRYFIYTDVTFEWDGRKALRNAEKHGFTFEDARTVFFDDQALDGESAPPAGEPRISGSVAPPAARSPSSSTR